MHVSTTMTKYCSRFLISILFMMFATISFGWSGHETYTYIVVNSLGIDVNELVEITKYSYVETGYTTNLITIKMILQVLENSLIRLVTESSHLIQNLLTTNCLLGRYLLFMHKCQILVWMKA